MKKSTLVIGASDNPQRYSYKATQMLLLANHPISLYGLKKASVFGIAISPDFPNTDIHTVTMYVGVRNQTEELINKIILLKPNRVIFNPGTENPVFKEILDTHQIAWLDACTLVLLSINQY
jgi:predicted CoA-binding protein